MQDTHSGRYSKPYGVPEPIIAYNNPLFETNGAIDASRIISDEELDSVRDMLVHSAVLAAKAGFDGVDIKCCHRYLNSELLSAFTREKPPGPSEAASCRVPGKVCGMRRLLKMSLFKAERSKAGIKVVTRKKNTIDGMRGPSPYSKRSGKGELRSASIPKRSSKYSTL